MFNSNLEPGATERAQAYLWFGGMTECLVQSRELTVGTQQRIDDSMTQPVFDVERFAAWWQEVTRRGLHERVAIVAGVEPLVNGHLAHAQSGRRPAPRIPDVLIGRLVSQTEPGARRAAAVALANETIQRLSELRGLRGFSITADGDPDVAVEVIEKSGLGSN